MFKIRTGKKYFCSENVFLSTIFNANMNIACDEVYFRGLIWTKLNTIIFFWR